MIQVYTMEKMFHFLFVLVSYLHYCILYWQLIHVNYENVILAGINVSVIFVNNFTVTSSGSTHTRCP